MTDTAVPGTAPLTVTVNSCAICGFFLYDGAESGLCRRFPPVLDEKHKDWRFPRMFAATGWCGEFQMGAEVPRDLQ